MWKISVIVRILLLFIYQPGCLLEEYQMDLDYTVNCTGSLTLDLKLFLEPWNTTSSNVTLGCSGNISKVANPDGVRGWRVVVPVSFNFTLTCHGERPVKWKYNVRDEEKRVSIGETVDNVAVLNVYNAHSMDTDYYSCLFNFSEGVNQTPEPVSIMVFVSDFKNLCDLALNYNVKGYVVPCRPTDPSHQCYLKYISDPDEQPQLWWNVTLGRNDKLLDGMEVNYDDTVGFTLSGTVYNGTYECYISVPNEEPKKCHGYDMSNEDNCQGGDFKINLTVHPAKYVQQNKTITLNCTISGWDGQVVQYNWQIPDIASKGASFHDPVCDINLKEVFQVIEIQNANKSHAGNYSCSFKNCEKPYESNVLEISKPRIKGEKKKGGVAQKGNPMSCSCNTSGLPRPKIIWTKDNAPVIQTKNEYFSGNEQMLIIEKLHDDALYKCVAVNELGRDEVTCKFTITEDKSKIVTIILSLLVASVIISIAVYTFMVRKFKKTLHNLNKHGLQNFIQGDVSSLDPSLPIHEQAYKLPFDAKKWEVSPEKLKLGKRLGEGMFGEVYQAEVDDLVEEGKCATVAVKKVRRTGNWSKDSAALTALAAELKIMIHLGRHVNVVSILGACTGGLNTYFFYNKELLVLVEYCHYGNLHRFLKKHEQTFVNQVDPQTGAFDPTLIQYPLFSSRSGTFSLNPSGSDDLRASNHRLPRKSCIFQTSGSNISSRPVSVLSTIAGEGKNVYHFHERKDSSNSEPRTISTQDLLCWGFQVARGMEYLASRRVLHGDLAARNVLLADDNIVKVCDFGLSKNVNSSGEYIKKDDKVPLPVKWMAVESLRNRVFSTQSDVWSYGVFLWELFSLACVPYPDMESNLNFVMKIEEGHRMGKPKYATEQVYAVMRECWHADPLHRPSFSNLAERVGDMLEETVRAHYVDLNKHNEEQNQDLMQQNQDYLAMVHDPTYSNWQSTHGYTPMRSLPHTKSCQTQEGPLPTANSDKVSMEAEDTHQDLEKMDTQETHKLTEDEDKENQNEVEDDVDVIRKFQPPGSATNIPVSAFPNVVYLNMGGTNSSITNACGTQL